MLSGHIARGNPKGDVVLWINDEVVGGSVRRAKVSTPELQGDIA